MKTNVLFLLTFVFIISFSSKAQRGVRIAYIDTEYILEKVPEYQDATTATSLNSICACMFLLLTYLGGMRGYEAMWTDLSGLR